MENTSTPALITPIVRVFMYQGCAFPDPDPSMTPTEVKDLFAAARPELLNAAVEGGEFVGDQQIFTLRRGVGTKG